MNDLLQKYNDYMRLKDSADQNTRYQMGSL